MKNLLDCSVGALVWWAIGSVLAGPSDWAFAGSGMAFFEYADETGVASSRWFMAFMYATTSATIVSGAVAERAQPRVYIMSTALMTGLIYLPARRALGLGR